MKQAQDLKRLLESIDHKSYPAYKDARGVYDFKDYTLSIDHVQGDPFASPSKVSVLIRHSAAGFPAPYFDKPWKKTALEDYLLRCFSSEIARFNFKAKGSGKSGLIATSRPGQEILPRTACEIGKDGITARFEVGFPAFGRTINSNELIRILFDFLPGCVRNVFFLKNLNPREVLSRIELAEDQQFIREELDRLGLVSFAADGSILPRETGISDRPMKNSVPFSSPASLRITLNLPHRGPLTGMAIRRGITLIVGGGYHGKSTLLKALEAGVYNHIAGDGREFVITDNTAVKLRAEDGRSINQVDISLFIRDLPNKKDTTCFSTADASGSTSQAAAVIEGIEAGARTFLIDEDTSATNFMLRDDLMQRIVSRDKEPITPFIERARDLYEKAGISTILVAGSSGAYFFIADTVIQMDSYRPSDITELVREACQNTPSRPEISAPGFILPSQERRLNTKSGHSEPKDHNRRNDRGDRSNHSDRNDRIKVKVHGKDAFQVAKEPVDLRFVEQLADSEQTAALAQMVRFCLEKGLLERLTVHQCVETLMREYDARGLSAFSDASYCAMGLALPRIQEIYACLSRFRG
jgi:predicted ABC-class ATPase